MDKGFGFGLSFALITHYYSKAHKILCIDTIWNVIPNIEPNQNYTIAY